MVQNIEMLLKRTFGDPDIPAAVCYFVPALCRSSSCPVQHTHTHTQLETLHELLETHVEDLSSYAMYTQEVNSCMLEWSPPHTSEKFWRENVKSFEADGFVAIHELAKIIATSKEPLNVQVCRGSTTHARTPTSTCLSRHTDCLPRHRRVRPCAPAGQACVGEAQHQAPRVRSHRQRSMPTNTQTHTHCVFPCLCCLSNTHQPTTPQAGTTTEEREGVKRHALLCMQKIMIQRYDLL